MKISVLIATRNRSNQLSDLLISLLNNSFKNYEILVMDQSSDSKTKDVVKRFKSKKISYFRMRKVGKSLALNNLVRLAQNEILAFTDDDCIADSSWLQEINDFYKKEKTAVGVFGNVFPYKKELNSNKNCPATHISKDSLSFSDPRFPAYIYLGNGNNMSIKKTVIEEVGLFKEWLGKGSITCGGEECELVFQILNKKYILKRNPKMIVHHNRWLSGWSYNVQESKYSRGLMSFFTFVLIGEKKGYAFEFMKQRMLERLFLKLSTLKKLLKEIFKEAVYTLIEIYNLCCGFIIGLIIGLVSEISKIFNT